MSANNPPAFPSINRSHTPQGVMDFTGPHGMTLRDYFAAKALVLDQCQGWGTPSGAAGAAYNIADAMLDERSKATGGAQ